MEHKYYCVHDWMVKELGLGGIALLVYALIYSFTVSCGSFSGSAQYIAEQTGLVRRTVIRQLQLLTRQGLLLKKETLVKGKKCCVYRAAALRQEIPPFSGDRKSQLSVTESHPTGDRESQLSVTESHPTGDRKSQLPVTESHSIGDRASHNNTGDITIHNTEDKTEGYAPAPVKILRRKYGEYSNVLLSDGELDDLRREFPDDWQKRIDRLSEYMASTGKHYKNHLATIRVWARRDAPTEKPKGRFDDLKGGLVL